MIRPVHLLAAVASLLAWAGPAAAADWPPKEPRLTLSVDDVTLAEGDYGPSNAHFLVRLSAPPTTTVTVDLETMDVSAEAGSDYLPERASLQFAPGQQNVHMIVTVNGDTTEEKNESLVVLLSNESGAVLDDPEGIVTIVNDDGATPPEADLSVSMTSSPGSILVDEPLTHTITVRNDGPREATWVTAHPFFHVLNDAGWWSADIVSQGSGSVSCWIWHCNVGTLAAGESRTFTIVTRTQRRGQAISSVRVEAQQVDPDPSDNRVETNVAVDVPRADLSVAISADRSETYLGEPVTLTITVSNHGPQDATWAEARLNLGVWSNGLWNGQGIEVATPEFGLVSCPFWQCHLGTIAAGASSTFSVLVKPLTLGDGGLTTGVSTVAQEEDPVYAGSYAWGPTIAILGERAGRDVASTSLTTDSEGDGATAFDWVETTVTAPAAGLIEILETLPAQASPGSFRVGGQAVAVNAPAAKWHTPIELMFHVDASVAGQGAGGTVVRNGTTVPACTGGSRAATPDPCVFSSSTLSDGDVEVVVLWTGA